jgi:ADP-ribose pyrophosphatase
MANQSMKVRLLATNVAYSGFFELRRLTVDHDRYAGGTSGPLCREVLHRSDVVAALLHDPLTEQIVLVEQFRAGVHVAGLDPWLVDIVAGRIEDGQSPLAAVIREIAEESGLTPSCIEAVGTYFTAPHLSSERVHVFYATVDASRVNGFHGVAHEGEDIRPVVLSRADAMRLRQTRPLSLWAALALNWLDARRPGQDAVAPAPTF